MAGYVFNMDSEKSIQKCFEEGYYCTALNKKWTSATDGTFADYLGMKEGDNIYFFSKRKIYGIGCLIKKPTFANHPQANVPGPPLSTKDILCSPPSKKIFRWGCVFRPSPHFFVNGVDMDDVLSSNPQAFTSLRAFWKLSFIKIDDLENQALKDIILYRNSDLATQKAPIQGIYHPLELSDKIKTRAQQYSLNPQKYFSLSLDKAKKRKDRYRREAVLECNIMWDLSTESNVSKEIFGHWDYVSHQVIASPFKPIDYMDKMDIWGYEYIQGFKTILKYKVCELKKGRAGEEELLQCMKYVEWIRDKYAHGDYSKIKAFLVAADFALPADWKNIVKRNYVSGLRDVRTPCWEDLTLVKYRYDESIKRAVYEVYKNAEK